MRRDWLKRLSGQLVLSHVFVAVVVLAFALGVAQLTFRHYLVNSQVARLESQGQAIARVMPAYFTGQLDAQYAYYLIHALQGTLRDQVYVVSDIGVSLETGNSNLPPLSVSQAVLNRVLRRGHKYRGIMGGKIAVVGVPVSVGPNIVGGVFLESPISLSNETANSLTRLLLLGELAAVILVGVLAYAISWRLSQPLDSLRRVVAGTSQAGEPGRVRATEGEGPLEVQALAGEFNRLQDRIDVQVEQLKREAEARDALMAHVAHDLRTPLTSIRGFLEAMRDGVATGDAHDRAVEVAWEETLRLQRLVDRLLRATRIRSEGGPMSALSTRRWVEKTLERVAPVLEQKHLGIQWNQRQDATIQGNEDFLVEALVNVLDNAIKWSPEGSEIVVDTFVKDALMVVRVADQGPGIPEELLPRVFERFVTGDASRQQSSGLGLSIVDEVMRQHHGEVAIHSSPEHPGTVVELKLPVSMESE